MRRAVSLAEAVARLGAMAMGADAAARGAMARACRGLAREATARGGAGVGVAVLRDGAEGMVGMTDDAAVVRELGTAGEPPAPVLAAAAMQSGEAVAAELARGVASALVGRGAHGASGHGAER